MAVGRSAPFVLGSPALGVALLLGACSGSGAGSDGAASALPSATSSRPAATAPAAAPGPTTTTAPADPYAVPEVIDAAYVNRVLAALYAIDGDTTREVLATGRVGL